MEKENRNTGCVKETIDDELTKDINGGAKKSGEQRSDKGERERGVLLPEI